jgi:hypothetical protein
MADIAIGLIDGPVIIDHPGLACKSVRVISGKLDSRCALLDGAPAAAAPS